jgi:hypothetical protein
MDRKDNDDREILFDPRFCHKSFFSERSHRVDSCGSPGPCAASYERNRHEFGNRENPAAKMERLLCHIGSTTQKSTVWGL